MSERREFFRYGIKTAAKHVSKAVIRRADAVLPPARVRPPGAGDEATFLMQCTRCGDCVPACPEHIIETLPPDAGAVSEGTPILNFKTGACKFCDGWPCIAACGDGALRPPAGDVKFALGLARIDAARCFAHLGNDCDICVRACPEPGTLTMDDRRRPVLNATTCTGCGVCEYLCVTGTPAIAVEPRER